MNLSGSYVDDPAGDEIDIVEVHLVAAETTAAPHDEVEFDALQEAELVATSPLHETGQCEGLEGKSGRPRLVRNRNDIRASLSRFLVSQRADSDIPTSVLNWFDL